MLHDTLSRNQIIHRIRDLWSLFSPKEQERILPEIQLHTFKRGELIYAEGENPDHLLAVLDGKVKIFRDGVGGRSQIIRVLRPVQYFGYRASMAHEPYVTAAAGFERSLIASIPMSLISEILAQNAPVAQFFIRELATDLGISDRRTVSLTQKHIRARLAESLLYLKGVYGISGRNRGLAIHLTREDLAALSNMTTSNAIRTLSAFVDEGLVSASGKEIVIADEKGLERISEAG